MRWQRVFPLFVLTALLAADAAWAQSLEDFGVPFSRDLFRSQQLLPNSGRRVRNNNNRPGPGGNRNYQPADPAEWGAPGAPGTPENVNLNDPANTFPPPDDPTAPTLQALFEQAGPSDPIPLKSPNKFITADRVRLLGVYYKGSAEKETVPVILLHNTEGKKEEWQPLAEKLSAAGMAVLVPDLRGHGESTTSWLYDYSHGGDRPTIRQKDDYLAESFTDADFKGMRSYDGLLWYQFLAVLHNAEKINLRRLVLIGDGYGATVAAAWLLNDWAETSPKKGRFAKNLILLSPESDPAFAQIADLKGKPCAVTGLLFVGTLNKKALEAAQNVQKALGKEKADIPPEEQKFPLETIKTEKEGTELFSVESFGVAAKIVDFLQKQNAAPNVPGGKWAAIK